MDTPAQTLKVCVLSTCFSMATAPLSASTLANIYAFALSKVTRRLSSMIFPLFGSLLTKFQKTKDTLVLSPVAVHSGHDATK